MEVVLSLGSCMGDSVRVLSSALAEIESLPKTRIVCRASFYETEAVDVPDEFKDLLFINTACIAETTLDCYRFSDEIHAIEEKLGRRRTGLRHEPRIIDIDLIACGEICLNEPSLILPHPEAAGRRFVMEPIAEMRPDFVLPGQSLTAKEIFSQLPQRPMVRLFCHRTITEVNP